MNKVARPRRRTGTVLVLAMCVVAALVLAYVIVSPSLDDADQQWLRCEVRSATPAAMGTKGIRTIKLATSCGAMTFDDGINAENQDRIAHSFTRDGDYEFRVGWLGRMYLGLGATALAHAWRPTR